MAVLAATLVALLCLPCVVAVILSADDLIDRGARQWHLRRNRRYLRRLDRRLGGEDTGEGTPATDIPVPRPAPPGPGIEQIAADLRRLHRQRSSGPTTESSAWLTAVQRAYDDRLCLACTCLGVDHYLPALDGIDRDIERLRVEGALEAAGLALRAAGQRPPDRLA
jgi:hypothetical protein